MTTTSRAPRPLSLSSFLRIVDAFGVPVLTIEDEMRGFAPGKSLTTGTVVRVLDALDVNVASLREEMATISGYTNSPGNRTMPKDVSAKQLKGIVRALASLGYDLTDEAAPFITAAEVRDAADDDDTVLVKTLSDVKLSKKPATPGPVAPESSTSSNPVQAGNSGRGMSVWAGDLNPDAPAAVSGFTCAHCRAYNLLRDSTKTYYVVTSGSGIGIYKDWLVVKPLVNGVSGNACKKFSTFAEALAAWDAAVAAGVVPADHPVPRAPF
ncbi:hypothetical protein CC2G_014227 [Coprinopsis cinerea AmutBmut pab1-1]|nr:hypothetical protein CC2G_014227 [Coprinopsis cinerea AmutBmut pab1-1]